MSIFAIKNVEEVKNGKLSFYKLIIDGNCLYDTFCSEMEKDEVLASSLNKIRAYMNFMAESDCLLPKAKFNSIKNKGKVIGYEFKDKNLRLYIIKQPPEVYVVLGGYKKTQEKDIKSFSKIREKFLEFIENKN